MTANQKSNSTPNDTAKLWEVSEELANEVELRRRVLGDSKKTIFGSMDENTIEALQNDLNRIEAIAQQFLDQQKKIERLGEALKQIQDYCDLGLPLFLKSNRFEHLVKLVDDILGGETAKDRWDEAARQGERDAGGDAI